MVFVIAAPEFVTAAASARLARLRPAPTSGVLAAGADGGHVGNGGAAGVRTGPAATAAS